MHETEFRLTPSERKELGDRLRSRTLPAEDWSYPVSVDGDGLRYKVS
jgi:hypothetical protein